MNALLGSTRRSSSSLRLAERLALVATITAMTQVSGCGSDEAELCELICDCTGCSTSESEDCADDFEDLADDAQSDGCDEEYEDFTSCAVDKFDCDDEIPDLARCDDEIEELVECLDDPPVAIGSVGDPCVRAFEICDTGAPPPDDVQCTGIILCQAQCIVSTNSCSPNDAGLADCLGSCTGGGPGDGTDPAPPGGTSSEF